MPLKIYESSDVFVPSDHGLKVGDYVDLICVGGGASGDYCSLVQGSGSYYSFQTSNSVEGGESSFGNLFTSANGYIMGVGGVKSYTADGEIYYGGHGAGGYLPGIPNFGGNGGSGCGLAGTSTTSISQYVNRNGPGNKGATGKLTAYDGNGGNGYGAGAGAHNIGPRSGRTIVPESVDKSTGGDSGRIAFGSVKITSLNAINITVGNGGVNEMDTNQHGAKGVVIVCW